MRDAPRVLRLPVRLISRGPERIGQDLAELALSPFYAGTTGWFFKGLKRIDPPKSTLDLTQQELVWRRSAELVELEGGF